MTINYRYRIENILITTDSAHYTFKIFIFLFPLLKNLCDCSKINCSPGKFCADACHCKTNIISLFILSRCHTHTYPCIHLRPNFFSVLQFIKLIMSIFMSFLFRLQCSNYASDTYLLALPVRSTGQS